MEYKVMGDRLIIEPIKEKEKKTAGGIIIPDMGKKEGETDKYLILRIDDILCLKV